MEKKKSSASKHGTAKRLKNPRDHPDHQPVGHKYPGHIVTKNKSIAIMQITPGTS